MFLPVFTNKCRAFCTVQAALESDSNRCKSEVATGWFLVVVGTRGTLLFILLLFVRATSGRNTYLAGNTVVHTRMYVYDRDSFIFIFLGWR